MSEVASSGSLITNFRGRSEHTLDGKGRLNIPSRFREVLSHHDDTLIIAPTYDSLQAFTMPVWEKKEDALMNKWEQLEDGDEKSLDLESYIRFFVGGATECKLDKNGRILLPPTLRMDAGIKDNTLILNGVVKYFEIFDKNAWESKIKPEENAFRRFSRIGMGR